MITSWTEDRDEAACLMRFLGNFTAIRSGVDGSVDGIWQIGTHPTFIDEREGAWFALPDTIRNAIRRPLVMETSGDGLAVCGDIAAAKARLIRLYEINEEAVIDASLQFRRSLVTGEIVLSMEAFLCSCGLPLAPRE